MKKYRLNLAEDGRVLSVTYSKYGTADMPEVDELPKKATEYRYVNGEFIHDPLPKQEPAEPAPSLPDRVAELEEALDMILKGATE